MSLVLLSGDLMSASRIEGAALHAGHDFRMFDSTDAAVQFVSAQRVPLVMVDLTLAGLDVDRLVGRLKSLPGGGPAVVAYGPHVHEATLAAAHAAGCDQVLSRGQFLSSINAVLALHAAN